MKKFSLLLIILIFHRLVCLGQVIGFDYSPSQLKSYKKIVITRAHPSENSKKETTYFIGNNGRITHVESFTNGELTHFSKHFYNSNGQQIKEENRNQVFSYDEKVNDHVPSVRDDVYFLNKKEYKNSKIVKELNYSFYEGSGTLDGVRQYEYNKQGKKSKEIHINLNEGLTVEFASGTDIIDSVYQKVEATKTATTYKYTKDAIGETHFDENGEIGSYSSVKVNANGNPVEIRYLDKDGSLFQITSYEYNSDGNLTSRKSKVIDPSKLKGDVLPEDEDYRIIYGKNKLPAEIVSYSRDKLVSRELVTYE